MKIHYEWRDMKELIASGLRRFYYVWSITADAKILTIVEVHQDSHWKDDSLFGCTWHNQFGDVSSTTGTLDRRGLNGLKLSTKYKEDRIFTNFWYAYTYYLRPVDRT